MCRPSRPKRERLLREPRFINRLKNHQQHLLNNPILERRRLSRREQSFNLSLRKRLEISLIPRRPDEELEAGPEPEPSIEDGVSEAEEVLEGGVGDGVLGDVGSGVVGGDLLVGEDPEGEGAEEGGEGGGGGGLRRAEGGDPVGGEEGDAVLAG